LSLFNIKECKDIMRNLQRGGFEKPPDKEVVVFKKRKYYSFNSFLYILGILGGKFNVFEEMIQNQNQQLLSTEEIFQNLPQDSQQLSSSEEMIHNQNQDEQQFSSVEELIQ